MIRPTSFATLMLACCSFIVAQAAASNSAPQTADTPAQKQSNAASATQDNSGTTGDQITKPPAAKGSTLIGCLAGPGKDGKFTLRNMNYRTGVEVLGPDNLKNDSGSKVKLTGQWQPSQSTSQDANTTEMRRFQVTDIEVVASTCHPPSATTPVSTQKRGKTTTYNAPSSDSPK
jgi:hypothetical protein